MTEEEKSIVAPDWCEHSELIELLNDTSWADELLTKQ